MSLFFRYARGKPRLREYLQITGAVTILREPEIGSRRNGRKRQTPARGDPSLCNGRGDSRAGKARGDPGRSGRRFPIIGPFHYPKDFFCKKSDGSGGGSEG